MGNTAIAFPNVAKAKLPDAYKSAKSALSQCTRIDECKDWANKAEAMASYAKQANDDSLYKMALRIQARASRRCGELLKQIEPGKTGPKPELKEGDLPKLKDASVPELTRKQAAQDAGLSEWQQKTVIRLANVPESDFDEAVESESPPTVTKLAELGTQKKTLVDLKGIPPEDYKRATKAMGTLRRFAEFCRENEPTQIAKAYKQHEIANLRKCVAIVDDWLDRFITHLPE